MGDLWLVAGLGCRKGCSVEVLQGLLEQALGQVGASLRDVKGIASLDRKCSEPGLIALAAAQGLPLSGYSAIALAPYEPMLSHRSWVSLQHTGCLGVAESAALAHCAALSQRTPRLCLPRLCSSHATVALAVAT